MALMKENEINKKGGFLQIVFGVLLAFSSFLILLLADSEGLGFLLYYLDNITLIVFVLLCVGCVLLAGKKSKREILVVLRKTSIPNGVLLALFQFVIMLRKLDDLAAVGPNVAFFTLAILYGFVTYLVATLMNERDKVE